MSQTSSGKVCKYCEMVDCPMHPEEGVELVNSEQAKPEFMTHPGIPLPMAIGGVLTIIILSHFILLKKGFGFKASYKKFDLLKIKWLKAIVLKPYFPLLIQSFSIFCFLLVIFAGLFGSQRGGHNIATILTWGIWWALLIFIILVGGSLFCSVCPWEGITSLLTSFSWKTRKKIIGTDIKLKKKFRNVYIAVFLFILLTWLELGQDITFSPKLTALIGLFYCAFAVICGLFFERRVFCRYFCFVGRIQGIYSLFSPLEVRRIKDDVCAKCTTMDCYRGNDKSEGCPTFLFPKTLEENTNCTLCTDCIRACPHDNLTINLRNLSVGLRNKIKVRFDEALMCLVLLALTSFHGLTMTPHWNTLVNYLRLNLGFGENLVFSLLMIALIILPILLFWLFAYIAKNIAQTEIKTPELFKIFSYSVLPIALFYHLAHNGMHFFMEAQNIIPVLSDPFGWGWNLFGTANKAYLPLLELKTIWWIQLILIVIGHLFSVYVSDIHTRRVFPNKSQYLKVVFPFMVLMLIFSTYSIWLISLPMEMKSGM